MIKKILFIVLLSFAVVPSLEAQQKDPVVAYNTATQKYHKPNCHWAKKCTKNCIHIKKSEAKAKGGRPCKVCGG